MVKYLILLISFSLFGQRFPNATEIDPYPWGNINAPTTLPSVEEEIITSNGTTIKRIAPSNVSVFSNRYPKLDAFNRNGTIIKLNSSAGGTAFYLSLIHI